MKPDRRGSWYLLTGVALGVALGLLYSWVISPVKYTDAPPSALRADYQDDYRVLVAVAYQYSNDLLRAESRLTQLKDNDPSRTLALQAQRAMAEGHPDQEVRALEALAAALAGKLFPSGVNTTPFQVVTSNPTPGLVNPASSMLITTDLPGATSLATPAIVDRQPTTSINSSLPAPTPAPSRTPGPPFILQESRLACNDNQSIPLIQVEVRDAAGQPVPSIEVIVTWETGQDHFFTGLQPEMGLGYADFVMTPDQVYSVQLAAGSAPVENLIPPECVAENGSQYWGSWYLLFVQP